MQSTLSCLNDNTHQKFFSPDYTRSAQCNAATLDLSRTKALNVSTLYTKLYIYISSDIFDGFDVVQSPGAVYNSYSLLV